MSTDDPIIDTRPPGFAKGQWFGPVPQERVRITFGNLPAAWSFLLPGVIVPFNIYIDTNPNEGFARWLGYFDADGDSWSIRYQWSVLDIPNGIAFWLMSLDSTTSTRKLRANASGFRPTIGGPLAMTSYLIDPPTAGVVSVTKHPLPGWSTPSEHFPGVILADDTP